MTDYLVQISQNKQLRNVIKGIGLPIPMPEPLRRGKGALEERPLDGRRVVYGRVAGASDDASGAMTRAIAETLARAGADVFVTEDAPEFRAPGEAYGRPAKNASALGEGRLHGLVIDATAASSPDALAGVFELGNQFARALGKCARLVVIGRPADALDPAAAAAQAALEGFVRSAGKELGRAGSTSALLVVERGAEDRLEGVLRFVLSSRSAFVSGQPYSVTRAAAGAPSTSFVRALDGKVALVTGAARGIGEATARRLAEEGAKVIVLDRPADDAATSALARSIHGIPYLADVAAPETPTALAQFITEQTGKIDIVVHNAGITRDKTLARMPKDAWDLTLNINLAAVLRMTDALLAGPMRDGGRIVALASISGIAGNVGQTNYAASKAGIMGMVRALSGRLASRGITVNAVAPGFIETRMTAAVPFAIREAGRRLSSLGQGGKPVDVAEAIAFLASPQGLGMTGNVLRVCGQALLGA
jgi:3-oxoacyl-[acyl-carrier protein] reductase